MDVEHLWFSTKPHDEQKMEIDEMTSSDENMVQTLTHMADKRLFKLVKWCKSLPLFKSILIDDQISLLINAWCELLVFSCCFRSLETPGVVRVSNQKMLSLEAARQLGIEKWIEKMLHFTDQLRRLKVDGYEYVSMKVIVLLTSGKLLCVLFELKLTRVLQMHRASKSRAMSATRKKKLCKPCSNIQPLTIQTCRRSLPNCCCECRNCIVCAR